MLGKGARRFDRDELANRTFGQEAFGNGKGWMGRGDGTAAQRHTRIGAGADHAVHFFERVGHRLFRHDRLGAAFNRQTRQIRPMFGIGGDPDDLGFHFPEHLLCIIKNGVDAVTLTEDIEPLHVSVSSGDELGFRSIVHRLSIRIGVALFARVVVMVKLSVDVEVRHGPVHVVHVEAIRGARRQIVHHAHPAQSDDCGAIWFNHQFFSFFRVKLREDKAFLRRRPAE